MRADKENRVQLWNEIVHPKMEENQNEMFNNDVNGTVRENSPRPAGGSLVGVGGTPGRHQTTNTRSNEQQASGTTEASQRKKWTKEENKEVWRCYIRSDPANRGYRKRMHNIWIRRNNPTQKEQRLADQARNIANNNWLSKAEREEIERELTPEINRNREQLEREERSEPEEGNENERREGIEPEEGNRDEMRERIEPEGNGEEMRERIEPEGNGEEMREKINKIKQLMESERTRIPSLKSYNQNKLKEKTKEVNEIIKVIPTSNITETNKLIYAGAKMVVELMEIKLPSKNQPSRKGMRQPPWKRRLENQVTEMRGDLSKLKEMADNNLKNKKKINELCKKFQIKQKGLDYIMEDLKQRIKAKAHKIQRYSNRNKGYLQNKLFQTNQRRLYNQLKGEEYQQESPEAEDCRRLWEGIWSNQVSHNHHAIWLQEIKREESRREKQRFHEITINTVRNQLKKMPNWKAPGPDEIHGYWLKNFKALHERIAQHLQQCIEHEQAPDWMTTGRTALIQKDKSKGNAATNYRPITCLPTMWKLLTGIISERLYTYLEETNTIPNQQKGCRRQCRGTKDQLLIDKMVMKNSKRRKANLSMAWIDYRKAFDMIPHTWLIECLRIYGAEDKTVSFLKNTMPNWKTELTSSGEKLAKVNIRRGIFQGDSLSPLLFIVAMIPMTRVLQKMEVGYQLKKGGSRINHLMFMDDIKLYGKSAKEIDTLVQTVRIVSEDIKMEFGIEKCALINTQRGKVIRSTGIQMPDGNTIKEIDKSGYKYLGILEGEGIQHQEMKDKIRKEYMTRVKAILKSKLNSGNMVKAINTWAVPVIRYTAGIVEWSKSELQNLDRKTRKALTMYKALHPRASTNRLYAPRKEGGKGLLSIEDCVNIENRALGQYLKKSEDEWLRSAWDENLIKVDEDPEKYKDRMKTSRNQEWHTKPMHGQFIRQTKELASSESWTWLQRGELKKETEGMIMAAQDQALRTRYIQRAIDKQNISAKCRKCNDKDETINHIASECPALAQNQYKKRHDTVAKALHWSLCKKYRIPCSEKWYEHQPQGVVENENAKVLWDYGIRTDRVIRAHRPDLTLIDKTEKKVSLIDVAVPWDSRVEEKEKEKMEKYQDLRIEVQRLWDMPVEVIPIIIGALGTIPRSLGRNLTKLEAKVAPGLMQKSVLLETAHIIRRVMDS